MSEVHFSKVKTGGDKTSYYTERDVSFRELDCKFQPEVTREWIAEFNALPQKSPNVFLEFSSSMSGPTLGKTLSDMVHEALHDSPNGSVIRVEGVGKFKVLCEEGDVSYRKNGKKVTTSIRIRAKVVYAELKGLYHDEDRKLVGLVCERCKEPLDSLSEGKSGCSKCGMTYEVEVKKMGATSGQVAST